MVYAYIYTHYQVSYAQLMGATRSITIRALLTYGCYRIHYHKIYLTRALKYMAHVTYRHELQDLSMLIYNLVMY